MGGGGSARTLERAPLLLLCWLCCWPDEHSSDSGKYSRKSTIDNESGQRSSDMLARRPNTSNISLHLPGTSGVKPSFLAHRSHEEIRSRRKSHNEPESDSARYFSAPSVIDQVIHRRDWNRSARELHIPLKPTEDDLLRSNNPNDIYIPLKSKYDIDSDDDSPRAPLAINESLSGDNLQEKQCKKHHSNIKCSKKDKESNSQEVKDIDATEFSIYIGEVRDDTLVGLNRIDSSSTLVDKTLKSPEDHDSMELESVQVCRLKDQKQSMNESIKYKERSRDNSVSEYDYQPLSYDQSTDQLIHEAVTDRASSKISMTTSLPLPYAPSVEPVSYAALASLAPRSRLSAALAAAPRARHASDGDILAPTQRPDSGAFSESDLELELDLDEPPPAYEELPPARLPAPLSAPLPAPRTAVRAASCAAPARRETAI